MEAIFALRDAIIESIVRDLKRIPLDQWPYSVVGAEMLAGKYDWLMEDLPYDGPELYEKLKTQKIGRLRSRTVKKGPGVKKKTV